MKFISILITTCFLIACAHQDLTAPCTFEKRTHCGPKLPLEKVVI